MGLLDKIKKPTDDYIAVSHFIKKLSEKNNFPVSDVITYLNHHDFVEKIHAFYIDVDLKITAFNSLDDYQNLQTRLDNLKNACMFTDFVWTDSNFDKLKQSTPPAIDLEPFYALDNHYNSMHWHLKKQDLADFEPLQGYVNFLEITPTPKEYPLFYKNDFFNLGECAAMIEGLDPTYNTLCEIHGTPAYNLVQASVYNGKFKPHPRRENDYLISADDFKEWLLAKNIFIDGFTNVLDKKTQDANQNQIADQQQIADLQAENTRLQARITQLESQLNQAKENGAPANLKGLEKVNYDKAKAKLFAQIVAKSIWDMDTTEQIKSGDMVQYVKSLLLQFDDDSRPQTDEVISDWLRDIKPNYAKQSGRPSKNTPNEIPLTFKK